jgi:large subunit ribosomal protein L22
MLRFQPNRGARMLEKVIKSAVGSAADTDQNGGSAYSAEELVVVDARIDGGPMMKRFRPMSRGQAFTILKRSSHISVELKRIEEL